MEALQEFSARTDLGPLVRFVDGIIVAVERGTPLADVLRAQAQDVRDTAKRDLMESAGKKEIAMMVPLVFGVLPLNCGVRRVPRHRCHQPWTVVMTVTQLSDTPTTSTLSTAVPLTRMEPK